jgi:glycosyltransferase involved in cell wall biosynthesis
VTARPARPVHVAIVVENVPVGVDTRLRKQLDDLVAEGFLVSVVTMRDPDNERYRAVPGVRLLEYPPPPQSGTMPGYAREYALSFLWAAAMLARVRLRRRVDVLQVCQPPDIYFPLCWALRWSGARIVVDQRDLMPETLAARYARHTGALSQVLLWLERRTQRAAHHTMTVNDYLRRRMIGSGAAPGSVSVVMNGPVLSRVEAARPDPCLRGGHDHLVCWIGKMGRQDRVDLVLDVADRVVRGDGGLDCGFVLVGDGECLDELRRTADERGLSPWVSFPGWLPEEQVFRYLASADLGVDTSLQPEVTPVKGLEYMAAGLPLVAFDLPESRALADGAAVLLPPGDTSAFADAVVELLQDPQARARLGGAGQERVRHRLSWERQSRVYLSVVAGAASSGEASGA